MVFYTDKETVGENWIAGRIEWAAITAMEKREVSKEKKRRDSGTQ